MRPNREYHYMVRERPMAARKPTPGHRVASGRRRSARGTAARRRPAASAIDSRRFARPGLERATWSPPHLPGTSRDLEPGAPVGRRSDGPVRGMRNTVAVMNTKGGVGKSTLVLAMAETLSAMFRKNVLIIDSDSQASVSAMLLSAANLHRLQSDGLTIVDLLVASVLNNVAVDWPRFVVGGVSDVDEARTVYLIPSDMQLTLFEREVSKESLHAAAAHQHRRPAQPCARRVRRDPDRLPARPVGADGVLAARGRFPLLADQARLRLDLRARGVPPLQGPQPGDGLCREPRRRHQHEGPAIGRWRPTTSAGSPTTPTTRCFTQTVPRTSAAAARRPAEPGGALLRRQVSRQIRRVPSAPCARSCWPASPPPTPMRPAALRAAGEPSASGLG
mgnify:CR=1 FL=1